MKKPRRAEQYERLLTADPPICGQGSPVALLNGCERRRRGLDCWCRFNASEISDDLDALGIGSEISLETEFDPDEVEDLTADFELALQHATPYDDWRRDAHDRLVAVVQRLQRIADRGSGLTDTYSDDIDP
jgi:hypothetical protein